MLPNYDIPLNRPCCDPQLAKPCLSWNQVAISLESRGSPCKGYIPGYTGGIKWLPTTSTVLETVSMLSFRPSQTTLVCAQISVNHALYSTALSGKITKCHYIDAIDSALLIHLGPSNSSVITSIIYRFLLYAFPTLWIWSEWSSYAPLDPWPLQR